MDPPERLGAVGFDEHGVAALDVHDLPQGDPGLRLPQGDPGLVPAREGAHPDLLEDLPSLGQPAGDVGEEVLGRPAFREVARPLRLLGAEECQKGLELTPAPLLVADQRPDVGPHPFDCHALLPRDAH